MKKLFVTLSLVLASTSFAQETVPYGSVDYNVALNTGVRESLYGEEARQLAQKLEVQAQMLESEKAGSGGLDLARALAGQDSTADLDQKLSELRRMIPVANTLAGFSNLDELQTKQQKRTQDLHATIVEEEKELVRKSAGLSEQHIKTNRDHIDNHFRSALTKTDDALGRAVRAVRTGAPLLAILGVAMTAKAEASTQGAVVPQRAAALPKAEFNAESIEALGHPIE